MLQLEINIKASLYLEKHFFFTGKSMNFLIFLDGQCSFKFLYLQLISSSVGLLLQW